MLRTISYKDTGPTLISTAFLPAAMPVGLVGILALLLVAFLAGIAGAFLGIGGGILIVPFITLGLGVDQKIATAVSIVAVIATSSGAASIYVRDRMTNLRLGMWLEISTTIGAVLAALLVLYASSNLLAILFAVAVLYAAYSMVGVHEWARDDKTSTSVRGLAAKLHLRNTYRDEDGVHEYGVERPATGLAASAVAGTVSGMLGVGGGIIQVPVMNLIMRVPIRAAVATSNFMIGVTGAASAFVYYFGGLMDPGMAGTVVLGVSGGTLLGTRLMRRTPPKQIRLAFAAFLAVIGVLMALRGLKVF